MYSKIAVAAIATLLSSTATFAQGPDKVDVKIYDASAAGTGCPLGSVSKVTTHSKPGSKGADYFQIVYDDFEIKYGKDVPARQTRKFCDFGFNIDWPEGYQFTIESLEFDGYADIHWIHRGEFESKIQFFMGDEKGYKRTIRGPFEGSFSGKQTRKRFDDFKSDCEGSTMVNLKTTLRLDGNDRYGESTMTMDVSSGLLTQAVRLKWRKCKDEES